MPAPFEFDGKDLSTYGALMDAAVKIAKEGDKDTAAELLGAYAEWQFANAETPITRERADEIARSNIGYGSGYYSAETATAVREVFDVSHPIFGRTNPTPDEALAAGIKRGEAAKRKESR
jgi:hypothetical protein